MHFGTDELFIVNVLVSEMIYIWCQEVVQLKPKLVFLLWELCEFHML